MKKKNQIVISTFLLCAFLCACSADSNITNENEETKINTEEVAVVEPEISEEEPEIEEIEETEEKVQYNVPEKYLQMIGLDNSFNEWYNTSDRTIDSFVEKYGMPEDGVDGRYYYAEYDVCYDMATREVTSIAQGQIFKQWWKYSKSNLLFGDCAEPERWDFYNPYTLNNNLTTIKPLMDIGYYQKSVLTNNEEYFKFPTLDIKVEESKKQFNEKYPTIFDLENDLGEGYLMSLYWENDSYIDFINGKYCVAWLYDEDSKNNPGKDISPYNQYELFAEVSLENNAIISLSEPMNGSFDTKVSSFDEVGIEY